MRIRLYAAATAAATALVLAPAASADPAPVTGVELNQPADQVVAVEAKFNLTNDAEVGIRELRKLRGDMWDQNVPFDGQPLRTVAAEAGLTTRDQYVNAVQLDTGYNLIALQRAAEAAKQFSHTRPFNDQCKEQCGKEFSATIGGKGGWGANLHSAANMERAMQGWGYGEVAALKRLNGRWSDNQSSLTGHLHNFLKPSVTRVGFAGAVTAEGEASAAVVGHEVTNANSMPEGSQKTVLHRPANKNETPNTTPKKLVYAGIGDKSPADVRRIVGIVLTVLSILVAVVKIIEPQLRPIADKFMGR